MNRLKLVDQLARPDHEGERLRPYKDTAGKLTIGIGRNLDDVGISDEEARYLALNDVIARERDLARLLPWFTVLDDVRQRVLVELAFNMGTGGLMKFTKMIAACESGAWDIAVTELLDSVWAREVGEARRRVLTVMLREGVDA